MLPKVISLPQKTCLLLSLAACGPKATSVDEVTPTPAPVAESPCALTVERVGRDVQVAGKITFVDDLGPQGMHADLEAEGCRVGIWVDLTCPQELYHFES